MSKDLPGLLLRTGISNTTGFLAVFEHEGYRPENVLRREETVVVRDCYIRDVAQDLWLSFRYDIDGIVSTFSKFSSIRSHFSFLNILPRNFESLIPVFNIVRKHLSLDQYFGCSLQYLKWSVSVRLFEIEGFEFHLALLPKPRIRKIKKFLKRELVNFQYQFFIKFRENFTCVIKSLPRDDLARGTIKKNRISQADKWFILPDDTQFILSCLDEALSVTSTDESFEKCIIAFKFGNRDSSEQIKIKAFDTSDALVSVHAAITISSEILDQHLLWSRFGLQDLIGERGVLYSSLSFSSCCNFQTNLDGRCVDISASLRRLCTVTNNLRFLHFYADTPHLHTTHVHPVFGSIVSCGVLHANVLKSIERKGGEYITLLNENAYKLCRVNARLELVCEVENPNSGYLHSTRFIDLDHLRHLLNTYPLIVPFADRIPSLNRVSFLSSLRSIPNHLVQVLHTLYNEYKRKGGIMNSWSAYQYELAAEIFWKGRPNSYIDNTFGNNLGPGGIHPERSRTWQKGFLSLEDCLSCATGESSIPPLTFHYLSDIYKLKIKRIFLFCDFLNGSLNVVGVRSVLVILNDVLNDPRRRANCDRSFISDLKQEQCPPWARLAGVIGLSELCKKLCISEQYRHPYVFGRVLQLIAETEKDSKTTLETGFQQLKLIYFPDVQFVDSSRNPNISWSGNGLLKIVMNKETNNAKDLRGQAVEMTRDIITYMEDKGLVFKSKFVRFFEINLEFSFPWVRDIMLKLDMDYLSQDEYVVLLAYLTCIGLLENSWYVDFRKFRHLHTELLSKNAKLIQELKDNEILSIFSLRVDLNFKINRLHESVPFLLPTDREKDSVTYEKEQNNTHELPLAEENEDNHCTDDVDYTFRATEDIEKGERRHCPSGMKGRWSPNELDIVYGLVREKFTNSRQAYIAYQNHCRENGIADRTFEAFKMKYKKMKHHY